MKRYDIEMNGDDMLTEEAPDGRWVEADEAEAELQKERDRRVEHVQQNRTLNEALQRDQAELTRWRAMFSTPEIAERHCEQIHAKIDAIQAKVDAQKASHEQAVLLLLRCKHGFDWNQFDSPEQNQIGRDLDEYLKGRE